MPTAFELLNNTGQFGHSSYDQVHNHRRTNASDSSSDSHPNDFGHVIRLGAENLNKEEKEHFLVNYYTPPRPPAHDWPAETRILNGKVIVRRLNPSFSDRDDCSSMAYSPMYGGLFCRFSHMFGNGGAVKKHINRKYHREAEEKVNILLQQSRFPRNFQS